MLKRDIVDVAKNYLRPVRYNLAELKLHTRARNSAERLEPSFMIIGAMKAGTTSLFNYLVQHPNIASPLFKEIHYFDFYWSRPLDWYKAHFPLGSTLTPNTITGEATPGYLAHPGAAERLASVAPDTKLIVLLRDPVERTLSHYFHERRVGFEERSLQDAIYSDDSWVQHDLRPSEEREWIESIFKKPRAKTRNPEHLLERKPMHKAYISRSLYADQLETWFQHFNHEQFLILNSGDLFSRPESTYTTVLKFLNLDTADIGPMKVHLAGKYNQRIDPDVIAYLEDVFAEPNRRLYDLLGIDFDWPASPAYAAACA